MENKLSIRNNNSKLPGIISICIPLIVFLLILNWFLKITPYQKLQGAPLLIAPFTSLIGLILSYISFKKSPNTLLKWGIFINAIIFALPFLYWIAGTLVFGQ